MENNIKKKLLMNKNKTQLLKECLIFLSELGHFKLTDLKKVDELTTKIKELV